MARALHIVLLQRMPVVERPVARIAKVSPGPVAGAIVVLKVQRLIEVHFAAIAAIHPLRSVADRGQEGRGVQGRCDADVAQQGNTRAEL